MLELLALSPHPDDAELFCGGTLATAVRRGLRVGIADLTRGEKASNGTPEGRRVSSLAACEKLGITAERLQLGLPDGALDADDSRHAAAIAELLRALRPNLLLAPWKIDRHRDHVAAHDLSVIAAAAAARDDLPLSGRAHQVESLLFYPCHSEAQRYDVYVDVGESLASWREALDCYGDQFRRAEGSVPTPINAPEYLRDQERRREDWGRRCGAQFAEAFVAYDGPPVGFDMFFSREES